MSDAKKLIVFEMNEVPFRVLDHFTARFPSSALAGILPRSDVFETYAEDSGSLSPWITWPTVHRGVTNERHGLIDFGQNLTEIDKEFPPIWKLLASGGVRTGVFGCLHSYPLPQDMSGYDFYMPDTFAAGPECFPETLSEFQAFNLQMVDASARNVDKSLMLSKSLPFLKAAPGLGLRGRTVASIGQQLVRERLSPHLVCRRRTTQVELAFDFYLKQLHQREPSASFFFTNHVASSLHRYWPGTFPDDYPQRLWADGYEQTFSQEITYTMRVADRMIGDLVRFVERSDGYRLMVMTSMGQQAVPDAEQVVTQLYCVDLEKMIGGLGVPRDGWQRRRAMAPEYSVGISPEHHDTLVANLSSLRVNGKPVRLVDHHESVTMSFGHENLEHIELTLHGRQIPLEQLGLKNVEIQDKSASFAYHIPQGVLISYDPAKGRGFAQERRRIGTTEIAPAILGSFGLEQPSYMRTSLTLN